MQYALDILINFIVFMIGSLFGSFYTLAIYRIPLKKNITKERSFCPNCKHKLNFFDLFPIFSYIFLRGRCRYCKQKIGLKYVLIELFVAAVFIMFFNSLNFFEISTLTALLSKIVQLFVFMLFFTFMFLTAFIDKEKYKIEDGILRFGIIASMIYVLLTYLLRMNVNYIYMLASATVLVLLYIIYAVLKDYKIRTKYYVKLTMFFVILSIYIPIRIIIFVVIALIPIYILIYVIQKIAIKKESNRNKKDIKDNDKLNENIKIKVEIKKGKTAVYLVEKRYVSITSVTEGKKLRLKDLKLKNITTDIHIPFALLIGLTTFIIKILFDIF